jgi:hypothetical protein
MSGTLGGGMHSFQSSPTVANSILWGNTLPQISGSPTVTYSCGGDFPGTGNIDADPLFVDPDNGDYHLQAGSPCIDAGHNWAVARDVADLDEDGDTTELTPYDLDGNPRFVADPVDFDPGCGIPAVVDMGSYEFQIGGPFPVKFADITGDGIVDTVDFLGLLAQWGVCVKDCCLPDFNLDGVVDTVDFLTLLSNWG